MDIEEALKHSSLGTPEARRLAEQVSPEVAQSILQRSKAAARRPASPQSESRTSHRAVNLAGRKAVRTGREQRGLLSASRVAIWASGVLAVTGTPVSPVTALGAHASLQAVGLSFSRDVAAWRSTRRLSGTSGLEGGVPNPFAWNVTPPGTEAVPVWVVRWMSPDGPDFDNLALALLWYQATPPEWRDKHFALNWASANRVAYVRFREIGSMRQEAMVLPVFARSSAVRAVHDDFVDPGRLISLFERWLRRRPTVSRTDRVALAARADLAGWYGVGGDPLRAVAEYQKLLADQIALFGDEHASTLAVRANLAAWRGVAGDAAAAIEDYARLLDVHVQLRGDDDPVTSAARADYVCWVRADGVVSRVAIEYKRFLAAQPQHEVVTPFGGAVMNDVTQHGKQKK